MMRNVAWTIVVWALAAGVIASQERDRALEDAVWAKLKSEELDEQVAEVVVRNGGAILRGKPQNAWMKMKAIEAALTVEGIEAVEDELDVASAESTEDLVNDLIDRVLTYPRYTVFDDIGFQIQDEGLVVVSGYVTEPIKKDDIEERIGKVRGVRELKSVIEVLPASPNDDRLRERLYESIYGNDLFQRYANRTHPPIRIIVKSSNVMLSGAVANRIEKVQAENIARGTFGVINVDNRLQVNP